MSAGMAVGMGIWLLFATGTPRHVSSAVLAANLALVVSIFWALVNHLSAVPALAYALGIRRQPLAALSGLLMVRTGCASFVHARLMALLSRCMRIPMHLLAFRCKPAVPIVAELYTARP